VRITRLPVRGSLLALHVMCAWIFVMCAAVRQAGNPAFVFPRGL